MKKQKTVKKHEQEYIHIKKPALKKVGNFFLGLILSVLTFFSFKLLIYKWKDLGLDVLFNCEENCSQFSNWMQLEICFNLIFTAVLIFLSIMFLFNLWNKIDWDEFIRGLIFGLIFGLIWGLIWGLIAGLITGLITGLIFGLIFGLIWGLIWGLSVGLIVGLN